jgi:hypothetical protein
VPSERVLPALILGGEPLTHSQVSHVGVPTGLNYEMRSLYALAPLSMKEKHKNHTKGCMSIISPLEYNLFDYFCACLSTEPKGE